MQKEKRDPWVRLFQPVLERFLTEVNPVGLRQSSTVGAERALKIFVSDPFTVTVEPGEGTCFAEGHAAREL